MCQLQKSADTGINYLHLHKTFRMETIGTYSYLLIGAYVDIKTEKTTLRKGKLFGIHYLNFDGFNTFSLNSLQRSL